MILGTKKFTELANVMPILVVEKAKVCYEKVWGIIMEENKYLY